MAKQGLKKRAEDNAKRRKALALAVAAANVSLTAAYTTQAQLPALKRGLTSGGAPCSALRPAVEQPGHRRLAGPGAHQRPLLRLLWRRLEGSQRAPGPARLRDCTCTRLPCCTAAAACHACYSARFCLLLWLLSRRLGTLLRTTHLRAACVQAGGSSVCTRLAVQDLHQHGCTAPHSVH